MRGRIPVLLRCSLLLIGGLLLLFPTSSSAEQRALRRVIESPSLQYPDMLAKISHRSPKIPVFVADAWRRSEISSVRFRDSWRRSERIDVLVADVASASRVYGAEHGRRFVSLVDLLNQNVLLSVSFVLAAVIISVLGARSNLRRKCTTMICVLERVMVPLDEHFQHARLLLRFFLLALGMAILFWLTTVYAAAAVTGSPTVLVHTEAFQIIDDADTASDLQLKFGDAVNEQLSWERTAGRFRFTDDLSVPGILSGSQLRVDGLAEIHGALTASGAVRFDQNLTINDDLTASTDAVLTFGASGGNETLTWEEIADRFTFSDDLVATGNLSASGSLSIETNATISGTLSGASTITFSALKSCDTIDTSANGVLSCGTDDGAGGGISFVQGNKHYVNQHGDTMTGTLIIRSTSGTTAVGLNVAGTISGRALKVMGTNGAYLLTASGAMNKVGIKTNGGGPRADLEVNGSMSGKNLFVASSMSGAGLTDCDGSGSTLQWDSNTERFSCRMNIPDTVVYSSGSLTVTNQSLTWADSNTKQIVSNFGVVPSITPSATTQKILVTVAIGLTAGSTDDETNVGFVYRNIGSAPTCGTLTQIVGPTMASFMTNTNESGAMVTAFIDAPATTSAVFYTVCTSNRSTGTYTTTSPNRVEDVQMSLTVVGADLAENYYTKDESIGPGNVVSIDPLVPVGGARKSVQPYDPGVLGVISTQPWHTLDDGIGRLWGRPVPVALAGRVPVKVTLENGPIAVGDFLTSSSLPGVAMKALQPGPTIGQALTSYDGYSGEEGEVLVFLKHAFMTAPDGDPSVLLRDVQALGRRMRALERLLPSAASHEERTRPPSSH